MPQCCQVKRRKRINPLCKAVRPRARQAPVPRDAAPDSDVAQVVEGADNWEVPRPVSS